MVADVLLGGAVTVDADSLGYLLRQLRKLDDTPHLEIARDLSTSAEVLRGIERGQGSHYVHIPLLFKYLGYLGLQIKIERKVKPSG